MASTQGDGPALFALIIGINKYKSWEWDDLGGAVADAKAIQAYLELTLKVPSSQIKTFFDEQATRDAIVSYLCNFTKMNQGIKRNDPILIYFAGHGAYAPTPPGWESGGPNIQLLIPHDSLCNSGGKQILGIPDRTIGVILEKLASEIGDNITVIFDCCHAGSMTRQHDYSHFRLRVRGGKMPVPIRPDLDKDIWGGSRGTSMASGFLKYGLRSHVLMAACGAEEYAREFEGRGFFTKGLLDALEEVDADKVTYKALIKRIRPLPVQNPQCEGFNRDRFFFDRKAPVRSPHIYHVVKVDDEYIVDEGAINGITKGSTFALHNDRNALLAGSRLVTLKVSEVMAFSTVLGPLPSDFQGTLDQTALALLDSAGEEQNLRIRIGSDPNLRSLCEALAKEMEAAHSAQPKFTLINDGQADLEMAFEGGSIVLNILDPLVRAYGLNRIPFTVEPTVKAIGRVIRKATHYFWHLRRTGDSEILTNQVEVEFMTLETVEDEYDDELNFLRRPNGPSLIENGQVDIVVDEKIIYGIKITNNSEKDLYLSLFYFDNSDLSISEYFQPPTSAGRVDPPLRIRGSLAIGYGAGGAAPFVYSLRDGQDVDVGYLKFFLSTEQVDLSSVPQLSPFEEEEGRQNRNKQTPVGYWSTLLIPLVQRRYPLAPPDEPQE